MDILRGTQGPAKGAGVAVLKDVSAGVNVWRAPVLDVPGDEALLSPPELARAARYQSDEERRHFVGSRTLLRRFLAGETGMAPEELEIAIAPNGKPFLANAPGPLFFSISHSGGLIVFAVSHAAEVGVDIERINPSLDLLPVAARHFTQEQYTAIREARGSRRLRLFFRLWTAREAVLKAWGCGCSGGVPPGDCNKGTTVSELAAPAGFMAALAVRTSAPAKA